MNRVKKFAYSVVLAFAAVCAAGAWADPATSYVSVSSGDATIVSMSA